MNDEAHSAPEQAIRKDPFFLFHIWQWALCGFLALLAIAFFPYLGKLDIPGAPYRLFWTAIVVFTGVVIVHMPPAFFRLPRKIKNAAYIAILPAIVLLLTAVISMQEVYERTPEGAKVKVAREAADHIEAEAAVVEANTQKNSAELQTEDSDPVKRRAELNENLKGCFSWRGQIPDLVDQVKTKIDNPGSFQHIETIISDGTFSDVEMIFRAENEFGAIRKYISYGNLRNASACSFIIYPPVEYK